MAMKERMSMTKYFMTSPFFYVALPKLH